MTRSFQSCHAVSWLHICLSVLDSPVSLFHVHSVFLRSRNTDHSVSRCIDAVSCDLKGSTALYPRGHLPSLPHRTIPLSSSRTRTIRDQTSPSPSCASSFSLGTVNLNQRQAWTDRFSITLSSREIGNASDEELALEVRQRILRWLGLRGREQYSNVPACIWASTGACGLLQ